MRRLRTRRAAPVLAAALVTGVPIPAFAATTSLPTAAPEASASPSPLPHPATPWASLAVPGAGQFLMGDALGGAVWLGAGTGTALLVNGWLRGQMPAGALVTPDTPQFWFIGLISYAAWLGMGGAATVAGLVHRQNLEEAVRPRLPSPTPAPATDARPSSPVSVPVPGPSRKPKRRLGTDEDSP